MLELIRTDAEQPEFIELVILLDNELAIKDGEDHAFYDQFNKLHDIHFVLLAKKDGKAVGCGAIKAFNASMMEVKRMYVLPEERGQRIAAAILEELEKWAKEQGHSSCILETGINQPEAIRLYERCGYERMENYGQYDGVETSFCFKKRV